MCRSVAGIVVRGDRILVAKRLPGGAQGSKWEFPGGKVEVGESDEDALRREYKEELDVDIEIERRLGSTHFEHHGSGVTLSAYRVQLKSDHFRLTEHSEYGWARLDEIETLDFVDSDRSLIPDLRRSLGGEAEVASLG